MANVNESNTNLFQGNKISSKLAKFRRESRSKSETFLSINTIVSTNEPIRNMNLINKENSSTNKLNSLIEKYGIIKSKQNGKTARTDGNNLSK